MPELRHLVLLPSDRLDLDTAAFDGFDLERERVVARATAIRRGEVGVPAHA